MIAPMTRVPADEAFCPSDLCAYGEPCCTPGGPRLSRRGVLLAVGWTATSLALAGAVLPLLPTTPFVLVAAWAFARSSPRMDRWLNEHGVLGPLLRDWRARRAVPRRAKLFAVATLVASWLILAALAAPPLVLAAVAAVMTGVGGWLATRPE